MVIIFSRSDDGSTGFVAEWLGAFNKEYLILNTNDDHCKFIYADPQNKEIIFQKNGKIYNLFDAESIWIRRTGLSSKSIISFEDSDDRIFFEDTDFHKLHIKDETDQLIAYIHSTLSKNFNKVLGSYEHGNVNKMIVLEAAVNCGLMVPRSFLVTNKQQLTDLLYKEKNIITKPLGQGIYRLLEDIGYYTYVDEIDAENIDRLPENFFPSSIQGKIEKQYELRVFYCLGKFYSMAIFSQETESTATDFRRPNFDAPNRHVPCLIPEDLELRLDALMKDLKLTTGSIDLILDKNGNYIFLEVNPVGQFSMTSYPCNYYLEKKIAEYL